MVLRSKKIGLYFNVSVSLILLAILILLQNCSPYHSESFDQSISSSQLDFEIISNAVLKQSCTECHSDANPAGANPAGGIDLSTYKSSMASGTIVPFKPLESRLFLSILNGSMPLSGRVSSANLEKLRLWIENGAQEFSSELISECKASDDETFTRLSNFETRQIMRDLGGASVSDDWFKSWTKNSPVHGFNTLSSASWDEKTVEERLIVAEKLSEILLRQDSVLEHCPEETSYALLDWQNCARPIVEYVGSRAFRRPLRQSEIEEYEGLFIKFLEAALERNLQDPSQVIGYLDHAGSDLVVSGWALDLHWEERSVEVHFYVKKTTDSPSSWGEIAGGVIANKRRPDLNQNLGVTGDHGFEFRLPEKYSDGSIYEVNAYGISHKINPVLSTTGTKTFSSTAAGPKVDQGRPLRFEFHEGLGAVLQAIFISPNFLFKPELLPEGFETDEEQFRLASFLSFFSRNSFPDTELWEMASNGQLTRATLASQADRLLTNYSGRFSRSFSGQWLGLEGGLEKNTSDLDSDMAKESMLVFQEALRQNLTPRQLLTPGFTFANSRLASHYGLSSTVDDNFQRIETADRGGLLYQGYFLTHTSRSTDSSPIHRGLAVLGNLLCRKLPALNPATLEEISSAQSRIDPVLPIGERMKLHRDTSKSCHSCHSQIDPIGLSLEAFGKDALWRTAYNDGRPIESWGKLYGRTVDTPQSLVSTIQQGSEFNTCFSKKILTLAMSRKPADSESCLSQELNSTGSKTIKEVAADAILRVIERAGAN